MSSPPVLLFATPPLAPLPASDAESLFLLSLLRLSRLDFGVRTGDWGVNGGKLPYLTHLDRRIGARHLASLPGYEDPDGLLSDQERAESAAWLAYIEATLVDLVNHTLYASPANYAALSASQRAGLAFPYSHYIPPRLRSTVDARLRAVGLGVADDEPAPDVVTGPQGTTAPLAFSWTAGRAAAARRRDFADDALRTRAHAALDPLARRIGRGRFFFRDRPTTLDLALLSHLTLLLSPSLSSPLPALLRETYPALVAHHDRTLTLLFPAGWSFSPRPAAHASWADSLRALAGTPAAWAARISFRRKVHTDNAKDKDKGETEMKESKQAADMRRGRWAFFAAATASVVVYVLASGIVQVSFVDDDDDDVEEGEDDDYDEDETKVGGGEAALSGVQLARGVEVVSSLPVYEDGEGPEDE
ncbi:hypothetical protein Q5752_003805 [Cryptotrichosporon argae]